MTAENGAAHLVAACCALRPGERVLVVGSTDIPEVAQVLALAASAAGGRVTLELVPPAPMHGAEPPDRVAEAMREATLIIGATSKSMAHTRARQAASARGGRYLSLPDYSLDLLTAPDLLVDYDSLGASVRAVAGALTGARSIRVTTRLGSDLVLSATGRTANACPGIVRGAGDLGSPPDIEANVSPLETQSFGRIVVDGSIAHPALGLLEDPVTLTVDAGQIVAWEGPGAVIHALEALFAPYPQRARILAECGIGMNPKAQLRGLMLTDEGCAGAVHFGFGSNATVGGENDVPFHLDFCVRDATVVVDGRDMIVGGRFCDWTGFPAAAALA